MSVEIRVPRLGWSMDEGTFVEWLRQDGDQVRPGDPLFVLEGDKSAQDIEAVDAGVLRYLPDGPARGAVVQVGQVIARLETVGEPSTPEPLPPSGPAPATPGPAPTTAAAPRPPVVGQPTVPSSPRARRVARELGVDWTVLTGTGNAGRVRERDVRAAARPGTAPAGGDRVVELSPTRRLIAGRMLQSLQASAPVTLTARAEVSNLVRLRDQFRATSNDGRPLVPSYSDLVVKLLACVLPRHPWLNARLEVDRVVLAADVHVGIAVDTDAGLVVPVVRDVARLGVRELAARSLDLIARARAGNLTPEDQRGGTFTVTNLGMYGIDAFTPIINPPQSAILGLGTVRREPAFDASDRVVAHQVMTLSLTFDHRIVDGAPAARFLKDLVVGLENIAAVLVD